MDKKQEYSLLPKQEINKEEKKEKQNLEENEKPLKLLREERYIEGSEIKKDTQQSAEQQMTQGFYQNLQEINFEKGWGHKINMNLSIRGHLSIT